MQYKTVDGKIFDDIEKAEKHEEELQRYEDKKRERLLEQKKRMKEVDAAYEHYEMLRDQYIKDFELDTSSINWGKFFEDIFNGRIR